jgi:hypothetical protein
VIDLGLAGEGFEPWRLKRMVAAAAPPNREYVPTVVSATLAFIFKQLSSKNLCPFLFQAVFRIRILGGLKWSFFLSYFDKKCLKFIFKFF